MADAGNRASSLEQFKALDRLNRRLEAGCGAVLGFAIGLVGALNALECSWGPALAIATVLALALGALARALGGRLLERILRVVFWWA